MNNQARKVIGYFIDASNGTPAHDPGGSALCPLCNQRIDQEPMEGDRCPVCGKPMDPEPVETISFRFAGHTKTSYFYRRHASCSKKATVKERMDAEFRVIDLLTDEEKDRGETGE